MKMKSIQLAIFAILVCWGGYGQDDYGRDIPQVTNPEVASFMKFEDINVNKYTGVPDISIPVFTLQDGEVNIPITLRYHASGIKVEEEASWVGLGWNLNVGGHVTRRANGAIDEHCYDTTLTDKLKSQLADKVSEDNPYALNNPSTPLPFLHYPGERFAANDYFKEFFSDEPGMTNCDNILAGYSDIPETNASTYSLERAIAASRGFYKPDIYSFTFPGHSGKFTIDRMNNEEVLQINDTKPLKIERITFDENIRDGWKVTDQSGVVYKFEDYEYRITPSNYLLAAQLSFRSPSTFYLTSIEYPKGGTVNFYYEEDTTLIDQTYFFEQYVHRPFIPAFTSGQDIDDTVNEGFHESFSTYGQYKPKYLSRIESENYTVIFNREDNRLDSREDKLSSIQVFEYDNLSEPLKEFTFNYDYFSPNSDHPRLKLTSFESNQENPYVFEYNEQVNLPEKFSYAVDFWGYYNGKDANKTYLPRLEDLYTDDLENYFKEFSSLTERTYYSDNFGGYYYESYILPIIGTIFKPGTFKNADRKSDENFADANILTKVTYPTKGYTIYDYELNSFSNYFYPDVDTEQVTYQASGSGVTSEKEFTVDAPITTPIYFDGGIAPANGVYEPGILNVMIEGSYAEFYVDNTLVFHREPSTETSNTIVGLNDEEYYNFVPGVTYKLKTYLTQEAIDHGYSSMTARVIFNTVEVDGTINPVSKGAGLRVKTVTKYDHNDALLKKNEYQYEFNGESSGKLMSPLKFAEEKITRNLTNRSTVVSNTWWVASFKNLYITSKSAIAVSDGANGSPVGYSKVVEKNIDSSGDFFSKESNFYNKTRGLEQFESYKPQVPYLQNGNLLSQVFFNSTNDSIRKIENTYKILEEKNHFGLWSSIEYHFSNKTLWRDTEKFMNHVILYPYCVPASTYALGESKTTDFYYEGDETKQLETLVSYNYNSDHLLSETITTDSKGQIIESKTYYPDDITGTASLEGGALSSQEYAAIQRLQKDAEEHRIGQPIQQETYVDGALTAIQRTNFNTTNNLTLPSAVEAIYEDGNLEERLTYNDYDAYGNPIEVSKPDGSHTMYIWGYNGQYPIAKIENASYTGISTSASDLIETIKNTSNIEDTAAQENALRDLFDKVRDDVYFQNAMITSYTYDPLIGVTSITDQRGDTTYYEYDEFQRLEAVKDTDGHLLSKNEYNYKN